MISIQDLENCCDILYGGKDPSPIGWKDIPCKETSDSNALCKNPLVSVCIVTYNHESYIADCLDGVLAQRTNFEFEIVLGEDCSLDRTREICFDYQRRFPDKIRVLWAEENVYRKGGNWARNIIHARGRYVAQLDGDDYWIDPLKLQKQIDLMRSKDAISCVANFLVHRQDGARSEVRYNSNGNLTHRDLLKTYPQTSTYLTERDFFLRRTELFPAIRGWYDVVELHCLIETGKVAYLNDVVSAYRLTGRGIATSLSAQKKKLLGVKQYLDLYLHGPKSFHHRFGSLVMTYVAFFFNRSTPGWTREFTEEHSKLLRQIFWGVYIRQFWDLRSVRAFLRYARFKLGMRK
ncbi:MAG: glycosyltransferase family 2 protein [Clostridia bacterium]|nr:glycosyltransferase family 2 protein [Clostridia bacterium]